MNEDRETVAGQAGAFRFRRYQPSPCLSSFVRNYWALGPVQRPSALGRLRIVPDGFTDIVFVRHRPTGDFRARVVGTMTRPFFEELNSHVEYLGIRLAPGGFKALFRMPAAEVTDRTVPVESLMSPLVPAGRLAEGAGIEARLAILDDALGCRLASCEQDGVLTKVLEAISSCRGAVSVAQLAGIAGWSPRHLHRTFRDLVGVGPKTYCRIIRFKSALRFLRRAPRPDLLQVALAAGYYDQAHFIHDFNDFYGASPSAGLAERHR